MRRFLSHYRPPNPSLWQGRSDSLPKERFFQTTTWVDLTAGEAPLSPHGYALMGFACDEGVRRNLGRIGAKEGPDAFRCQFAKLACQHPTAITDVGNIVCENDDLESAQHALGELVSFAQSLQQKTLIIGGGHEVAWGHFKGLSEHYERLGIINFDAHFDLRPMEHNRATSGTPFWQMAQFCKDNQRRFDYCCLGIQNFSNTKRLFEIANEYRVSYLTAEQIQQSSLAWQTAFLDEFLLNHEFIYLSLCLDVFAECFAPGVSAPVALGLSPWQVLHLIKHIVQSGKVVALDIAELAPVLDSHHQTARLAAMLLAEILAF